MKFTYDPHWLAITRAMHSHLSLSVRQPLLPSGEEMAEMVKKELWRIQSEGLLVPLGEELVWEKGLVEVERVQKFWPTAPVQGQGGSPSEYFLLPSVHAVKIE